MPGYNHNNNSYDVDDAPYGLHRGGNLIGTPTPNGLVAILKTSILTTSVNIQIFSDASGSDIEIRGGYSGHWGAWTKIDSFPSFYKNYASLAALATALGLTVKKDVTVNSGQTVTIDAEHGFYVFCHGSATSYLDFIWVNTGCDHLGILSQNSNTATTHFGDSEQSGALCVFCENSKVKVKNNMSAARRFSYVCLTFG